jgi:hypothetical protein
VGDRTEVQQRLIKVAWSSTTAIAGACFGRVRDSRKAEEAVTNRIEGGRGGCEMQWRHRAWWVVGSSQMLDEQRAIFRMGYTSQMRWM